MYDVVWDSYAEQDLAAVWMAAADRNAVTTAIEWVDQALDSVPLRLGLPRTSSVHRVVYHGGLGVEYEMIEDNKRVIVQGVFTYG